MSTQKTTLKNIFLIGIFLFISTVTFAQKSQADTLVINTVKGKMILISDSLAYFKNANTMVLINKALEQVKDSLPKTDSLKKKERLPKDSLYSKVLPSRQILAVGGNLGAGIVLGNLNPQWALSIDFATQRQDYYAKNVATPHYTFINLALTGTWFFEKPNQFVSAQHFHNIFLEASIGNRFNNFKTNGFKNMNEASFGVGYLVRERGNYFGANTFKLYVSYVPKNSFVGFKPEVFFTNNFKTVYPGISLKLVLPGR